VGAHDTIGQSDPDGRSRFARLRPRVVLLAAIALLAGAAAVALPAGAISASAPGAALLTSADGNGYGIVSTAGQAYDYGSSATGSSTSSDQPTKRTDLDAPVVSAVGVPHGRGSWLATRDGRVVPTGGAPSYGGLAGDPLRPQVTAIAATPSGHGYWLATTDGRVAGFGDARRFGDLAGLPHEGNIVALAPTPTGRGYRLATAGGSVVSFGDAAELGSPRQTSADRHVADPRPLVALLDSATGRGYLAVADDGTTYAYGDFADPGSLAGMQLTSPVVAAAPFSSAQGVWLLTRNGGVIALHAPFYGSAADEKDPHPTKVSAPYYDPTRVTVDGAAGGLVVIPCRGGAGMVVVNAILARPVADLLAAAGRDGLALCATSSFRNSQQQIALRKAYCTDVFDPAAVCSRPVALPGRSLHEQGLAVDFSADAAGYAWLAKHATDVGLHHLAAYGPQTEPWHYSINGG
jgi:hypothetical protein